MLAARGERGAGRILGLDLGDARVGLALSDPLGITAQPLGFMPRTAARADLQRIQQIVERHEVERVIVGLPLLMSGRPGARARQAERFVARLRGRLGNIPVESWDERLTTAQAERTLVSGNVRRRRRRQSVDSLAAVLILQSYLDARATGAGA